jgi:hypothetical protein
MYHASYISSYGEFHLVQVIIRGLRNGRYSLESYFFIKQYRRLAFVNNNYLDFSNILILQYFHQFVKEICGNAFPSVLWMNGNFQNSGADISMAAAGD